MNILIFTQKYPMGNYLLNQRVAEWFESMGHKVLILPQFYLSERGFAQYIGTITNFKPVICYYEMLDKDTFNIVSMLKCEKILVLASLGIFGHLGIDNAIEKLKEMKGKYYTKIYTNSYKLFEIFNNIVPSNFFQYYFSPIKKSEKIYDKKYDHDLVFLGMGYKRTEKQSKEKEIFFDNLKNENNFSIYGAGWVKEQYPCYKGLLPPEDIGKLYTFAKAGIAMIQEQQAKLGMINNRYIEMMSCGLPIYSLYYNSINFDQGNEFITFVETKKEAMSIIKNPIPKYLRSMDCDKNESAIKFAKSRNKLYFDGLKYLMLK